MRATHGPRPFASLRDLSQVRPVNETQPNRLLPSGFPHCMTMGRRWTDGNRIESSGRVAHVIDIVSLLSRRLTHRQINMKPKAIESLTTLNTLTTLHKV